MTIIQRIQHRVYRYLKDTPESGDGIAHLCGVSLLGVMLAKKRGKDTFICSAAGFLHDLYRYRSGRDENHAHEGARLAEQLLPEWGCADEEQNQLICTMIRNHSGKTVIDDPYSELLKDADALHHHLYFGILSAREKDRILRCMEELSIP